MADSTLVALKAVITRLRAYSALTAITTPSPDARNEKGIFSGIVQNTVFPYVLVEIESRDWSQDDNANMQHTVRVHGFSDKLSPYQAMQIAQEVYNALDRQEANITLDSGDVVLCIFSGIKTTFKEPDGIIWHSVTEFTLIID